MLELGSRIRYLRQQKGLSQRELGELVGVHQTQISFIELNERSVSLGLALKLSEIFGITVDDLLSSGALETAR